MMRCPSIVPRSPLPFPNLLHEQTHWHLEESLKAGGYVLLSQTIRIIFMTLILGGVASPALAGESDFERLLDAARAARDANQFSDAARLLKKAYAIRPMPVILNNLGKAYEELGRYQDAYDAYRRGASDPKAEPALRALDEARQAKLAPMLGRAWVRLGPGLESMDVYAGLPPVQLMANIDRPFNGGHMTIEFRMNDGRVVLRQITPTIGRRLTIDEQLLKGQILQDAIIELPKPSPAMESLTIGGHHVSADLTSVNEVAIQSGTYAIEATFRGGIRQIQQETLRPGQRIKLAARVEPDPMIHGGARQLKTHEWVGLATMTAGIIAGGVGIYQLVDYQGAADELMANNGISQRAAYAERQALYEQRNQGHWFLGAGVAVGAIGLGLFLWDREESTSASKLSVVHQGGTTQFIFRGEFQ